MSLGPDDLDVVQAEKLGFDVELGDVSRVARSRVPCIPVPSYLASVVQVQHRIEDGLYWQPGREGPPARFFDKFQFHLANWAIQRPSIHYNIDCGS